MASVVLMRKSMSPPPRSPAPPGGERESFTQTEQERVRLRRRRAGGPRMGLSTNGMTMHWQASLVPASGSTYAVGDEDGRWRWRWEMGRAVRCGGGLDVLFTACGRHANYNMVKGLTSLMRRPTFSPFPVPSPRSLSLNRAPAGVRAHNSQREATRKKKKKKAPEHRHPTHGHTHCAPPELFPLQPLS